MSRRQVRVLVVDDLPRWRKLVSDALRRGNFHVDTVTTTAEAQQRLAESYYHMLVLDIRMEDRDLENEEGMDLLEMLSAGMVH